MDNKYQIEAVARAQLYIEEHLDSRMSLFEIAQAAQYSPWHISRLFKEYTGKTIFDYIRALRLSRAALYLRDNNAQIIDVALEFIFETHEGFTRAFAKQFGINPSKYAKRTPPIKLFMPYPIAGYNKKKGGIIMKNELNTVFVQVIDRPKRAAIIKRGVKATDYFEYCEEVDCEVWGELCSVKGALFEPMGMWLPAKLIKSGTSKYVQGVEVPESYDMGIPKGFEIIILSACKMMIFQGRKYDDADFEREVLQVMKAIDDYDPTQFGFAWADNDAPRFQYEPQGSRGYIEGRPVKLIVK